MRRHFICIRIKEKRDVEVDQFVKFLVTKKHFVQFYLWWMIFVWKHYLWLFASMKKFHMNCVRKCLPLGVLGDNVKPDEYILRILVRFIFSLNRTFSEILIKLFLKKTNVSRLRKHFEYLWRSWEFTYKCKRLSSIYHLQHLENSNWNIGNY